MEINVLFVHPDESRKSPGASNACFGKLEKIPGVCVSLSVFDEEFESLCVNLECSKAKKFLQVLWGKSSSPGLGVYYATPVKQSTIDKPYGKIGLVDLHNRPLSLEMIRAKFFIYVIDVKLISSMPTNDSNTKLLHDSNEKCMMI